MKEKKARYARVSEADNIGLALVDLHKGEELHLGSTEVTLREDIPYMHKFSLCAIPCDADILKRGEVIGHATRAIAPGEHVHVHNMHGNV